MISKVLLIVLRGFNKPDRNPRASLFDYFFWVHGNDENLHALPKLESRQLLLAGGKFLYRNCAAVGPIYYFLQTPTSRCPDAFQTLYVWNAVGTAKASMSPTLFLQYGS